MLDMFKGIAFSPLTLLTTNIGSSDTVIEVDDISGFPEAPNFATIGLEDDMETIQYNAIADNFLSGCIRGVEGVARTWVQGEPISRNFTNVDYERLTENIRELNVGLDNTSEEILFLADALEELGDDVEELSNDVSDTVDNISSLQTKVGTNTSDITALGMRVDNKVDKVEGKGLSSNDFTNAAREKLEKIEDEANKTVLANNLTTTAEGYALDARMGRVLDESKVSIVRIPITQGSYRRSVIALCEVTNLNPNLNSYSVGTLAFKRENGVFRAVTMDVHMEKNYGQEGAWIDMLIRSGTSISRLLPCTFSYNGTLYGGLDVLINNLAFSETYFSGKGNFTPFGIDYLSFSPSNEILNEEIYSSINYDNITYGNLLKFNDNDIFHAGRNALPTENNKINLGSSSLRFKEAFINQMPQTISVYVNSDTGDDNNDGLTEGTAKKTIKNAIDSYNAVPDIGINLRGVAEHVISSVIIIYGKVITISGVFGTGLQSKIRANVDKAFYISNSHLAFKSVQLHLYNSVLIAMNGGSNVVSLSEDGGGDPSAFRTDIYPGLTTEQALINSSTHTIYQATALSVITQNVRFLNGAGTSANKYIHQTSFGSHYSQPNLFLRKGARVTMESYWRDANVPMTQIGNSTLYTPT